LSRRWVGAVVVLLGGCVSWSSPPPPAQTDVMLERADQLAGRGDYAAAVQAYDQFLATRPDDRAAARAQASRDTAAGLLSARAEIARLRGELEGRETEVARLRQEITRLTTETERLRSEADRFRADLEKLKRLDLEQERRRR
jgi:predicted RNase H-like nuclease (RuvC/YqgF family)